jgi:hypothetical protein
MNDLAYQIRPFEVKAGETDRVLARSWTDLQAAADPRPRAMFEIMRAARRGWLTTLEDRKTLAQHAQHAGQDPRPPVRHADPQALAAARERRSNASRSTGCA